MGSILVVEDQRLSRIMLCDLLRANNYDVLEATDGSEGLDIVENNDVSLVISDLVMPFLDGANFLSLLTPSHPEIEVIALTSLDKDHELYKETAQIIGKDRVLAKKEDTSELLSKIKSILGS